MHNLLGRSAGRKEKINRDIETYGHEILDSEELKKAYLQRHHTWSTVGEHTLRVAAASLAICYALRRLHVQTDVSAVVKGSLCHDLGILGREEKYRSKGECSRRHPVDSVKVARELLDELPEKSVDIIEHHMWPAGHSKAPNTIEGVIVSAADKYAAVKDIVQGSDVKQTGIRQFVRRLTDGKKPEKDRQ